MELQEYEEKYETLINKVVELDNSSENIFKILKQESMENKHSIFLGWLLNPKAKHGYKGEFAQRFFDCIFKNENINANDIEKIVLEQPICGEKQKQQNIGKRRIDILIIGKDFTCTIENKYGSEEHGGQCKDYRKYVEGHETYKKYGERNKFVFLDVYKPKDFDYNHKSRYSNFTFFSYKDIRKIISELIENNKDFNKGFNKMHQFVLDYKEILDEKYGDVLNDPYKAVFEGEDGISKDDIWELSQINIGNSTINENTKRFLEEVKRYYEIKKHEYDCKILENLKEISKDKHYIKAEYGREKGEASYAYAIPVSVDKLDDKEKYLFDISELSKEEYNKLTEKEKKNKEKKVKETKNDNDLKKVPFQTIDFRAPMDNFKNINILILAGYKTDYLEHMKSIFDNNMISALRDLENKGWKNDVKFIVKDGSGENTLDEIVISKEKIGDVKNLLNYESLGHKIYMSELYSDKFLEYIENIHICELRDFIKKVIKKCIDSNKTKWIESEKYIDLILEDEYCKEKYSNWKKKNRKEDNQYKKIYNWLNDIESEEIKRELDMNSKIEMFEEWFECEVKKNKKDYKEEANIDKNVYSQIQCVVKASIVGNPKLDKDLEKAKAEDKYTVYLKELRKLTDQRKYKCISPYCCISMVYVLQADDDDDDIQRIFYEKSIEGAAVFGLGEWYRDYVYKDELKLRFMR